MTKNIYLDTDCIISFAKIKLIRILCDLYSGDLFVPSEVYRELKGLRTKAIEEAVNILLSENHAKVIEGVENKKLLELYVEIKTSKETYGKQMGKGECHALALAIIDNGIIASNNMSDVEIFVRKYKIGHITTSSTLCTAVEKGIIKTYEARSHWITLMSINRYMPTETFDLYYENYFKKGII